jgi:hypothetical protein
MPTDHAKARLTMNRKQEKAYRFWKESLIKAHKDHFLAEVAKEVFDEDEHNRVVDFRAELGEEGLNCAALVHDGSRKRQLVVNPTPITVDVCFKKSWAHPEYGDFEFFLFGTLNSKEEVILDLHGNKKTSVRETAPQPEDFGNGKDLLYSFFGDLAIIPLDELTLADLWLFATENDFLQLDIESQREVFSKHYGFMSKAKTKDGLHLYERDLS